MRKSKFIVAVGAAAALAATPLLATTAFAADGAHSNSGAAVVQGTTAAPSSTIQAKVKKQFDQPVKKYTNKSCAFDISGLTNFQDYTSITGCGGNEATFSSPVNKRQVAEDGSGGWRSWGSPPDTEDAFPAVLYSNGAPTLTISFSKKSTVGGVEIEPDPFEEHSFTLEYFKKADGTGKSLGAITVSANGDHGARLLGAKTKKPFKSFTITDNEGVGYSIAQIRSSK